VAVFHKQYSVAGLDQSFNVFSSYDSNPARTSEIDAAVRQRPGTA
jgi:hypothetical protein